MKVLQKLLDVHPEPEDAARRAETVLKGTKQWNISEKGAMVKEYSSLFYQNLGPYAGWIQDNDQPLAKRIVADIFINGLAEPIRTKLLLTRFMQKSDRAETLDELQKVATRIESQLMESSERTTYLASIKDRSRADPPISKAPDRRSAGQQGSWTGWHGTSSWNRAGRSSNYDRPRYGQAMATGADTAAAQPGRPNDNQRGSFPDDKEWPFQVCSCGNNASKHIPETKENLHLSGTQQRSPQGFGFCPSVSRPKRARAAEHQRR